MRAPLNLSQWLDSIDQSLGELERLGIHTFSNGTESEGWLDKNCFDCRWWDELEGGASCAFEFANFIGWATPDLARLFGWTQSDATRGERFGWRPPQLCTFYWKVQPNGDYSADPVPECPATIDMFNGEHAS